MRPIVQTGLTRHPALPDLPTVHESGFAGFNAVSFWGAYAPAGTPSTIVDRFNTEFIGVLRDPEISTKMQKGLLIDPKLAGPAEFKAFFLDQVRTWGAVIRENGLKRNS